MSALLLLVGRPIGVGVKEPLDCRLMPCPPASFGLREEPTARPAVAIPPSAEGKPSAGVAAQMLGPTAETAAGGESAGLLVGPPCSANSKSAAVFAVGGGGKAVDPRGLAAGPPDSTRARVPGTSVLSRETG